MKTIIVAKGLDNAIGQDNELLCRLSNDLKFFKKTTSGHLILMGRKTYESINRPLPNRVNVILTNNKNYKAEGCHIVNSITEAEEFFKDYEKIFIIGGAQIYNLFADRVDRYMITQIKANFPDADSHFTDLDYTKLNLIEKTEFKADEKNEYDFDVEIYTVNK
ncbi:MAG: dihydrofolate reductase [Flavobacteriaceae bacterium]|nr:dihydrofolate reductase [Flavobacteriaceae bacterium]